MAKVKICIVDDDPAYTYLVKLVIRSVDPEVEISSFTDGDYALEFISDHLSDAAALPDIMLLDINMPRMDGWGFLDAYRQISDQVSRPISIYILSSSISDADLSKAKSDPLVSGYIIKPMEETRLADILKTYAAG